MISKNKIKLIRSLAHKKYRQREQLFLVEGDKNVLEILESDIPVAELFATRSFIDAHAKSTSVAGHLTETDRESLRRASLLVQPQNALALCRLPSPRQLPDQIEGLALYLDGIRDPGNLGTILRTSTWFGVSLLLCSSDTADLYNPKVIQSSMGTFCRVPVLYTPFGPIPELAAASGATICGTFMEGDNLYQTALPERMLIVLGNEGCGIRSEIAAGIEKQLTIPSFARGSRGAESLNVAMAAAIVCSEYQRQQLPIQNAPAG